MKSFKLFLVVIAISIFMSIGAISVSAVSRENLTADISALNFTASKTSTVELRNKVAKNWTFEQQGYLEQNCLGWALGIVAWCWPWDESASFDEVDENLSISYNCVGYSTMSCDIYAYGDNNEIVHFARGINDGPTAKPPIDAKWGSYEIFLHSTTDPYYTVAESGFAQAYGRLVRAYIEK